MPTNNFERELDKMRSLLKGDSELESMMSDLIDNEDEEDVEGRFQIPYVSEPPVHEAEWSQ